MPTIGPRPSLSEATFTSFDGDPFPFASWLPDEEPTLIVIGLHGIAGASSDLSTLGEYLLESLPGSALYAPDLRGQGNDPNRRRRGDILDPSEWFNDVRTFTRLVREQHPAATILWCGESMGSLIALHAAVEEAGDQPLCDALILSSPIARIRADLPAWRRTLLRWAAYLFPRLKISLEKLSGEGEVRVIKDVVHQEQVQTNPYHIAEFSLRLLNTLGNLVEAMPAQAAKLTVPALLLHGGKDIFSHPEDVESFEKSFLAAPQITRKYYPQSYHLLFYDHEQERVLADIGAWIEELDLP